MLPSASFSTPPCLLLFCHFSSPYSHFLLCCVPIESKSLPDLLREDPRPALLHGGPFPRGHANMDGRDSNRRRGLHTVYDLRGITPAARVGNTRQVDLFFQWNLNFSHPSALMPTLIDSYAVWIGTHGWTDNGRRRTLFCFGWADNKVLKLKPRGKTRLLHSLSLFIIIIITLSRKTIIRFIVALHLSLPASLD